MMGVASSRPKIGRRGRGPLVILALILASSGALRLGADLGAFIARPATATTDPDAAAPLNCPPPPLALTEALIAREERLRAQEAVLAEQQAAIALSKNVLDQQIARLEEVEKTVGDTLARADGAAEGDLARLTEMYQAMKPKDAATLFQTMAPQFAAGFLGRMTPVAAGAILAALPAETAYQISVILAGRHAQVPKN
jgi:flagellar motility protein MotE (MotC chaperone)